MASSIHRVGCELPIDTMTFNRFSEQLAAMKIRGKWGFIGHDDRIAIQPTYDEVYDFKNGLAVVKQKGFYGVVDKTGSASAFTTVRSSFRFTTSKYCDQTKWIGWAG